MAGLEEVDQRGWPLPSRRVTARLRGDERLVAATRQHWVKPAWALAVPTAVAGLLIWLAAVLPPGTTGLLDLGWVVWLGLVVRMGWRLWGWSVSWFAVTDERLLLSYGRLTHKLAMMPLSKVTDMTYVRTSVGQTLGFGEFVLESAGQDQALHRVRLLPRSQLLYDLIYEQLARRDRARHAGREVRASAGAGSRTPAPRSRDSAASGGDGSETVRVSRSVAATRAGPSPEPVRVQPADATQVVETGPPTRRAPPERTPGSGEAETGREGLARRAWSAVSGGSPPSLPTAPPPASSPPASSARPSRSGQSATRPAAAPSSRQATGGAASTSRRSAPVRAARGWTARAWQAVRGGDGSRL